MRSNSKEVENNNQSEDIEIRFGNESNPGHDLTISYMAGSEEISIRGNVPHWALTRVSGRGELAFLRDSLKKICKDLKIK